MECDLRRLIDDFRFRAYQRELLKPRAFNTFDVLRYADYEIRHSNVLAWLLQPADTHGIGRLFLEWFVDHVNKQLATANVGLLPTTDFEAANVAVKRELDYVDITIFLKREKCLIAIENKTGPASSEHYEQVMAYEGKLLSKYPDHVVRSVLLTTSLDGSVKFPGIAHVGWDSVQDAIGLLHNDGKFHFSGVATFVRQYLDMVERWLRPAGDESFKTLLDDHRSILKKMRGILEKDGDEGVGGKVPKDRAEYRDALVRLVKGSRQDPKWLRKAVTEYLKGRGCRVWPSQNHKQGKYWINWTDKELVEVSRSLSGEDKSLTWGITFTYRDIGVGFYLYQRPGEEKEKFITLDRVMSFIRETPLSRHEPDKYRISNRGFGWHRIYYHQILSKDKLDDMSGSECRDEVLKRLKEFMGSDGLDYRRIVDYFRCLAFRPL